MAELETNLGDVSIQRLSPFSKEALQKISKNLSNTLWIGIAVGIGGIVGYALNIKENSGKLLFLLILLGAASYITGFFLGFLFGIPKRNIDKESAYNLSTNLVDISDWLTKIIIGLGLVEIRQIPGYLQAVGLYIQQSMNGEASIRMFSVCSIVYFSIFGLYYGYNYMRLFLSAQFKEADDNLLQNQEKLSKKGEELNNKDLAPNNLDGNAMKKVNEYEQLLKSTKTEIDYTFEDWYYKGVAAYDKGENTKTVAYMNNALDKDNTSKNAPDAYLYIGLAYHKLQLYDKAIEATTKIITSYRDYPYLYLAYGNNGIYYEKLKQYDKAMDQYEKATELNPSDVQSWYGKAIISALNGDKDKLLANLQKVIELNENYKNSAKTEKEFEPYKEDEDFKKLVA